MTGINDLAAQACRALTTEADPNVGLKPKKAHEYFVNIESGQVFVKEGTFFRSQGGMKGFWGRTWRPIMATCLEHARAVGQELLKASSEVDRGKENRTLPPLVHTDDIAVDLFAARMKNKLAQARLKGRGGWDDRAACEQSWLSLALLKHAVKGDPVDVGNFAMFLSCRDEGIDLDAINEAFRDEFLEEAGA